VARGCRLLWLIVPSWRFRPSGATCSSG